MDSKSIKRITAYLVIAFFFPKFMLFYLICGIIDVARNGKAINKHLLYVYFLGHGSFVWLFAPFNLLLDILGLPYWNKGISTYDDFPKEYQEEIDSVLNAMKANDLVERLEPKLSGEPREMIFFKWYNKNLESAIDVSEFHASYKHIKTIGISVFNERASTSKHFGPFRATYRILFNINKMQSQDVYIDCCGERHFFHKNPLYIFDDTLMHQSVNNADESRYCAFIDISRPSRFPKVMDAAIDLISFGFSKLQNKLYRNWKFIEA